jgi:hypothetical protein
MVGPVLGSGFSFTAAKILSVKTGKDKSVSEQTDVFGVSDTIYAVAQISNLTAPVTVKAQLLVEDIPGQQPGPIKGLETT